MPDPLAISVAKLARLIGTRDCPAIIDIRRDRDQLIPASLLRSTEESGAIARALSGRDAIVLCEDGRASSAGIAALLRTTGARAEILQGGWREWLDAGLPTVPSEMLPRRDAEGRTLWVTRSRPKVDRIACPWLIRRFVDPSAQFLFVGAADVGDVAASLDAAPFDVDGAFWGHRGDLCTFDVMVEEFGLAGFEALRRLAVIVRGADNAQLELTPQSAGLLAASLGLSRMYADDLEQLDAGMILYDSLYRWCRDATGETHDQVSHRARGSSDPRLAIG